MSSFSPARLIRLAHDLESWPSMLSFTNRYLSMLPGRVHRVLDALTREDPADAMDATLSLRTSSMAVGAHELVELAQRVEDGLRSGDLHAALADAAELHRVSARTLHDVQDFVSLYEPS